MPGQDCKFMKRKKGNGQGCSLHRLGPDRCDKYHCSNETESNKLKLINYALENKLVTQEEANQVVLKILGKKKKELL